MTSPNWHMPPIFGGSSRQGFPATFLNVQMWDATGHHKPPQCCSSWNMPHPHLPGVGINWHTTLLRIQGWNKTLHFVPSRPRQWCDWLSYKYCQGDNSGNKIAARWSLDLLRIELWYWIHAKISTTCCKSRKTHLTRRDAIWFDSSDKFVAMDDCCGGGELNWQCGLVT